jgi:hypothetical protein
MNTIYCRGGEILEYHDVLALGPFIFYTFISNVHSSIGRSHFAMMDLDLLSPWLVYVVKAPISCLVFLKERSF